jgi:hypothetical protein
VVDGISEARSGTTGIDPSTTVSSTIGAADANAYPWVGEIALSAIFKGAAADFGQLNALYKATLGKGLGLP